MGLGFGILVLIVLFSCYWSVLLLVLILLVSCSVDCFGFIFVVA